MVKFKKGDKVRCLRAWHYCETVGQVYTVSNPDAGTFGAGYIRLEELEASHPCHNFDRRRYELVQEPPAPKEFRVILPDGLVSRRVHLTLDAAEQFVRDSGNLGENYRVVELVPVKTVKVNRTLEEVKQ